jgi:hypothetical protein
LLSECEVPDLDEESSYDDDDSDELGSQKGDSRPGEEESSIISDINGVADTSVDDNDDDIDGNDIPRVMKRVFVCFVFVLHRICRLENVNDIALIINTYTPSPPDTHTSEHP